MTLKIPGYRITRPIAEGGMASVYLAMQESLDRPVVLKLLKKFTDVYQSARFVKEGRIIASLNHRNIITIYDIGVFGERHYLSMEYVEGGNLEDRILEGMSPAAALDLVEVIGGCLDFLHKKNIIHRDIKPANILFHDDGTPVLTDFGVAKHEPTDSHLTRDGTALGSPYYISPEQAESKPVDGRADIYSLGIILYEMLTGKKPFQGESDIQIIISHLSEPVPTLPDGLEAYQELVDRMIAKNPDERFSSAEEMLLYIKSVRQSGCRPSRRKGHSGFFDETAVHETSMLGNAFRKVGELREDTGGMRVVGTMAILLLVAVVALQTTPFLTTKAQQLLAASNPVVPVHVTGPDAQGSSPSRHLEYLSMAREALKKLRYTKPEHDNAYYYYQLALKDSPGNEQALQGIAEIAEIQADLVEWALGLHEYGKAREYLATGMRIDPHNQRLVELAANDKLR
ncbi:MAG TPA: serine/threonine-protein kinase [Gammaproteobacteria bacterium]|nr:serine/threonine-protein kinase [Gammaproteobacteria bacterium]